MPSLPVCTLGAPPGRPPGATRRPPRVGGLRGLAVPPELRRREQGAVRGSPAAAAADRIRVALTKSQGKLLDSQRKLQSSVAMLRAALAFRR